MPALYIGFETEKVPVNKARRIKGASSSTRQIYELRVHLNLKLLLFWGWRRLVIEGCVALYSRCKIKPAYSHIQTAPSPESRSNPYESLKSLTGRELKTDTRNLSLQECLSLWVIRVKSVITVCCIGLLILEIVHLVANSPTNSWGFFTGKRQYRIVKHHGLLHNGTF